MSGLPWCGLICKIIPAFGIYCQRISLIRIIAMTSFKPRRLFLSSLLAAMGLAVPLAPAWAQPFPSKPVRIVIGFPPGGGIDIVARTIAPKLSEALGQPVIIDNKPGVAGVLGTNLVAKAPMGTPSFLAPPATSASTRSSCPICPSTWTRISRP
jgi:hypothetical protein